MVIAVACHHIEGHAAKVLALSFVVKTGFANGHDELLICMRTALPEIKDDLSHGASADGACEFCSEWRNGQIVLSSNTPGHFQGLRRGARCVHQWQLRDKSERTGKSVNA